MDLRSDRSSVHPDRFRLSSFPRQRWSQISPSSYASPVVETAGPSHQANPRRYESTLDESARAYRASALRQLNGNPKPLSRKPRQANPTGGRSSTLASQPVLVRTYSGNTDDNAGASKMPSRRSFPFASSSSTQERRPPLPSDEDFSIDGILRAIEPNIRGTLDSIAEICGRSKLSLANEYGSHIAPLGEIRAPPGGLLTVEEASPGHEQQSDENVVIYDDENSLMDGGDHSPFSHYRYLENIRQAATTAHNTGFQPMMPFPSGDESSMQAQPESSGSNTAADTGFEPGNEIESTPTTKEFTTKSKSSGRALLGKNVESSTDDKFQNIVTPAVVSETYLDAQGNGPLSSEPRTLDSSQDQMPFNVLEFSANRNSEDLTSQYSNASVLADLQALFNWLKHASHGNTSSQPPLSAEMRLRAMLERETEQSSNLHADRVL
ncbi:hypothetical protein AWENTII_002676 [Aspergillus wentii]